MNYIVVLPAAGSGKRMRAGHNKLFLTLRNKPILIHTLEVFEQDPNCAGIWLAVKPEERMIIQEMLDEHHITKVKGMPAGGEERQHSVYACIQAAEHEADLILVHDAARPFIEPAVIKKLAQKASETGAAIAGVKAKDTMKRVHNHIIEETVDREQLWIIQTPQAFQTDILVKAQKQAEQDEFLGTDESMLVERLNIPVHVVESTYDNVKMTTQEDLLMGEAILQKRQQEEN
ncbi:2-C-methyl-D-erythritol 4-phosphate cytidylyltransferase [Paenisporosarcina quisquiliarum]|uniref:2-C-methyl-D-erythritol 4-phosphate cytidylyltransferase n=1 Tax=Paenisporosarcina quisquiliarum TaxID=365346 RepID=A0A9X3LIB5_9BACL|nr:2-C-methyl-D-erythritol 4-phosphate cytidylyltransferase [Paenisporosarcina quisquiliarum]MCZ8537634.1 2-C-methyl-D-erythritol 4-phosphate cytidylyltransferase [Paenisporosarcina quisquiliarum]